jgi:hypothetical protein
MNITSFYDFMQVLHIKRKHPTKNEYLTMHILFSTIYLLQEHKLNHRNYSTKQINMSKFAQHNEHDMSRHEKFRDLIMYAFV